MLDHDALEFAKLAERLQAAPTPTATAEDIVGYVRDQLDADHASITLIRRGGRLDTIAPTGPLAVELDRLQYSLHEGPCYDSAWHSQTLTSTDLADDNRWPRWAGKVVAVGVSSILAVELNSVEDRRIGAINTYWARPRKFTTDDIAFANIFARHAALALAESMEEAGLNVALDTRKLIGQAQGILMERYALDEARAFEVLRRYSQHHNLKLRDVAAQLTASRTLPSSKNSAPGC